MLKKRKYNDAEAPAVEDEPEKKGHRVTNNSTTTLQIGDVKLKPSKNAYFSDFNPDDAKYKGWIAANMLSVEEA